MHFRHKKGKRPNGKRIQVITAGGARATGGETQAPGVVYTSMLGRASHTAEAIAVALTAAAGKARLGGLPLCRCQDTSTTLATNQDMKKTARHICDIICDLQYVHSVPVCCLSYPRPCGWCFYVHGDSGLGSAVLRGLGSPLPSQEGRPKASLGLSWVGLASLPGSGCRYRRASAS